MPHVVAVVAFDGISPFHLSVPSLVFGARVLGGPHGRYDVVVCALAPGTVATDAGYDLAVPHGLEALERADSIVIPSWHPDQEPPQELLDAVRAAHQRGARVIGLCLGAFVVAAAGIADGLEVATHWYEADRLAARYGAVRVRPDVLWSDHGSVITSAGVAAALDCCLHVVRTDLGTSVAEDVARSLVLAPHRDGSQAQFIREPVASHEGGDEVDLAVRWALDRLEQPLDLDTWSASVHVSRRTFTRRFRARTGTSPTRWLLHQRLTLAQELLETSDEPIEEVARRSGFGTAAALRQHFAARFRTSPGRHRREFRTGP